MDALHLCNSNVLICDPGLDHVGGRDKLELKVHLICVCTWVRGETLETDLGVFSVFSFKARCNSINSTVGCSGSVERIHCLTLCYNDLCL